MKLTEVIQKYFLQFLREHEFTFRFDEYNGTEASKQIYEENVVEYEFINQGNTMVIINDGLRLYPTFAGIEPSRIIMGVKGNENDRTIYNFKFAPIDFRIFTFTFPGGGGTSVSVPFISTIDPGELFKPFNRLIVKSKQRASHLKKLKTHE